jgi:hypothetical protein
MRDDEFQCKQQYASLRFIAAAKRRAEATWPVSWRDVLYQESEESKEKESGSGVLPAVKARALPASKPQPLPVALHHLLYDGGGRVGGDLEVLMNQRTFGQHRLAAVQGGNVGALEEFPDGYLLTPEH